jgi:hypothetical protein
LKVVVHAPVTGLHESVVQGSKSLQPAPGAENWHPVAGLQVSVVHRLPSLQTMALPWQTPLVHLSLTVHTVPSEHANVLFANTHPDAGLHESVVQGLLSLQLWGAPTQEPWLQKSPTVHALPSLQAAELLVKVQPPGLTHPSVVQGLLSLQVAPATPWQLPAMHTSTVVHTLPSLQELLLNWPWHP